MDRPTTRKEADTRGSQLDSIEALILPSRRLALELCRPVSKGVGYDRPGETLAVGPVLVTGEAGAGKTWLWKRLAAESPPRLRWIAIDLTPSNGPTDLYRLIGHELGLIDPGSQPSSSCRVGLVDFLVGRHADGERFVLVVEEAHNLSADLWEEVRVLANRLGHAGGFVSVFLVGQTALAVRFSTRAFAAIEARLASKVHLGPIGVDEAKLLLDRLRPDRDWSNDELELLHRDASGNPRRLLRLAARRDPIDVSMALESSAEPRSNGRAGAAISHRQDDALDRPEAAVEPSPVLPRDSVQARPTLVETVVATPSPAPLTGPEKPPIQFEENMIEVGWSPEDATTPDAGEDGSTRRVGAMASSQTGEEAVRDHYAALQAWREWADNQARRAPQPLDSLESQTVVNSESDEDEEYDEEDEPTTVPQPRVDRPIVRVEGEQKFAPFGQLFSKMAQARELE